MYSNSDQLYQLAELEMSHGLIIYARAILQVRVDFLLAISSL